MLWCMLIEVLGLGCVDDSEKISLLGCEHDANQKRAQNQFYHIFMVLTKNKNSLAINQKTNKTNRNN